MPRLQASKPARLVESENLIRTCAEEAGRLMSEQCGSSTAPVVGVVVNTVAAARAIHERLDRRADAVLLTGRIRPFDREALVAAYLSRIRAGRSVEDNPSPLFVVATQTVEVGADLDFDALVTENAALDALRQRFGRLNRLGRVESAPAVIARDKTNPDPPVYGAAAVATWRWLKKQGSIEILGRPLEDPAALSIVELAHLGREPEHRNAVRAARQAPLHTVNLHRTVRRQPRVTRRPPESPPNSH